MCIEIKLISQLGMTWSYSDKQDKKLAITSAMLQI